MVLVLDEADRLLDLGFTEEVMEIIKATPVERQSLLYSATFGTKVDELISLSLKRPVRIKASTTQSIEVAPRLTQEFIRIRPSNEGNREAILLSLLTRTFKTKTSVFFEPTSTAPRRWRSTGEAPTSEYNSVHSCDRLSHDL